MFKRTLPTITATIVGWLVLLGTFFPRTPLYQVRSLLIQWAMVLGAFALLLAYLNILQVHLERLAHTRKQWTSSFLVIVSALGTLIIVGGEGSECPWTQLLLNTVLVPGESALLALTAIILILTGIQLLRVRRNAESIVFLVVVVLALFSAIPYWGIFSLIKTWLDTIAIGGMRGIVMGVALGATMTGIRIIVGIDRPHSEE